MIEQQSTVSFITSELAETGPDLIVSFASEPSNSNNPYGLNNLILLRTPKYECILPPEEHGVSVSFDGNASEEKGLLRKFSLGDNEAHVYTDTHHYSLDLRKIEREALGPMRETIRTMNFDESFQTEGV